MSKVEAGSVKGWRWWWDHTIGALDRGIGLALVLPILLYQRLVSPMMPPTCRFHPSCSAYAAGSLRAHGAVKGLMLGTWRLLRCNPWNAGGLDPVPSRGRWRPDILPDGRAREARQHRSSLSRGSA